MPISTRDRSARGIVLALIGTLVIALGSAASALAGGSATGLDHRTVDLQLLGINDFHGNLEPPTGSSGRVNVPGPNGTVVTVNAGGVTYLATHLKALRQGHANTITVSSGDNIGASPLISGYFHDESTIEALNALGVDISSVGNHEFDEGPAELLRMQNGGCRPSTLNPPDSCPDPAHPFTGASFDYLSANVVVHATGQTLFPAYEVRNVDGVRVAFIGLTLQGTPSIVTPAGTAGLDFLPEAATVNHYVDLLERRSRVEAFVVLIHEGGFQTGPSFVNDCTGINGAIVPIVQQFDSRVDVVLSAHTHQPYNCEIANTAGHDMLVTSASSFGRLITDIDLKLDRATGDVYQASADNVIVTRDVTSDPAENAIIARYNALIADVKNAVVGSITGDITRTPTAAGEEPLGDVIADAQLGATTGAPFNAQIALMNPGGIRADMVCDPGEVSPCPVIFNEVFSVQPFSNDLVTMTLTGDQIKHVLEQQFDNPLVGQQRFLQVSDGFGYSWSASAPTGSKVSNITLNGIPIDPSGTYRVTVNSFLSGGGDGFTVLASGTNKLIGEVDLQALVDWFGAHSPVAPGPVNRYSVVP